MADVAAARREARRRRILENSQNRLQLISGKVSEDSFRESPSKFCCSEESTIVPESTSNSSLNSLPVQNGSIFSDNSETVTVLSAPAALDTVAAGDTEITNDLAAFMTSAPAEPELKKPLWDKLVSYKYDIALLALINQLFYSIFTFETTYFFLPIILYSITKLVWYPVQVKSNIANAFLLLNGMSANRVHSIMNLSQWFVIISQDICVYLFVTICTQALFVMLNNLYT